MRSARTVSSVMRTTLGWSVAAAASAGRKRKRQRMMARRINEKGACIVADSFFGTKTRAEDQKMTFAPSWAARAPPCDRNGLPEAISGVCPNVEKLPLEGLALA